MKKQELNDDEFDLESLVNKLFLMFKKLINWLLFPVKLMFKNIKQLTILISVFLVAALIIRFVSPPIYKSHFVLKPSNQGDLNFAGLLFDIKTLVKDNDTEELSKLIRLDESICDKIFKIDFEAKKRLSFNKYNDSVNNIIIEIYSYDRTNFDTIQKAIYNYLENTEYYAKSRDIRIENIGLMEKKLNKDMSEIDSLKKLLSLNAIPRNAGGFVYGEPINPMNIYEKAILIYEEQLSLNYQKQYTFSFELVKKCIKTKKRFWPKLSILLPAAFILGGIMNLILNLITRLKRKKEHESKKN